MRGVLELEPDHRQRRRHHRPQRPLLRLHAQTNRARFHKKVSSDQVVFNNMVLLNGITSFGFVSFEIKGAHGVHTNVHTNCVTVHRKFRRVKKYFQNKVFC